MSKELKRRGINDLHTELEHHLEHIIQATGEAIGLQFNGMFNPSKACTQGNAKKAVISMLKTRGCSPRSALYLLHGW